MKNIRYDFLTKSNIVFAKKRENRPNNFEDTVKKPLKIYREDCPFCPGNEDESMDEVVEFKNNFGIRIINNKYPVVSIDEEDNYGHHYVVIEDSNHNGDENTITQERFFQILRAYKVAINNIKKDEKIKYVQIFKNCKRGGGASLEHPHSQIIALDHIPKKYLELCDETCDVCEEREKEENDNLRIVARNNHFIAYAPFASVNAYQIRIALLEHKGSLLDLEGEVLISLAEIYENVMSKLRRVLEDFPYNLGFYSLEDENFHFFLDIYPRKISLGGFELSSGMLINSKLPEDVASEINKL